MGGGHEFAKHGRVCTVEGPDSVVAKAGMKVFAADVIKTGADGSVGITFLDNSLISTGPNSVFAIDQYAFDSTTHVGQFDGTLKKGTLAAISGKIILPVIPTQNFMSAAARVCKIAWAARPPF